MICDPIWIFAGKSKALHRIFIPPIFKCVKEWYSGITTAINRNFEGTRKEQKHEQDIR